jgi:hypothetical protein
MEAHGERRCTHCGRVVYETRHSRTSYRVDYYSLHTGAVEPVTLIVEDEDVRMTFQKLVTSTDVITCVDCYCAPAIRGERERRFRPERAGGETA